MCLVFRVVLYAIAMADYDQDGVESCERLLTTREGVKTIALYSSSIGRSLSCLNLFLVYTLERHFFYELSNPHSYSLEETYSL